jgi:hypothetical protein
MSDMQEHPHLEMGEHFHAKHAHKYIAAYLFIVVLLLLTGGIYTWQHKQAERLTTSVTTLKAQVSDLKKQLAATTEAEQQRVVTPDASWNTFCSVMYGECFQYPASWAATTVGATTTVVNAGHTAQVVYTNPATAGKLNPLHANSMTNVNKMTDLKVIGGYYADAAPYKPFFGIINATQKLPLNHITPNTDVSLFTDKNKRSVHLWATIIDGFNSTNKADNWLTSSDGKTAQAIVQSFYYK